MYLYHTTPLHYLPHILDSGALYAQSVLAVRGITPRSTAVRRDRMLGLANWLHLSLYSDTPLLRDKMVRGYPHALLVFERAAVLTLPDVALLPYNTKAWRTRAACRPVTGEAERADLMRRHLETGRFPSLEVLVHYGLGLAPLVQITFFVEEERVLISDLLNALRLPVPAPLIADPALFPKVKGYQATTGDVITAYFFACREAGKLLPPPRIPFD